MLACLLLLTLFLVVSDARRGKEKSKPAPEPEVDSPILNTKIHKCKDAGT